MSIITNNIEKESIPLTAIEASIVTEQRLNSQSTLYNLNPIIYFKGALSEKKLEAALQKIVERHSILTAYYPIEQGDFVRKLRQHIPILEKYACETQLLVQEIERRNTPYDLNTGPLYRFTLFELAPQSYALHLGFHHAIMDATSFGIVLKELVDLYNEKELAPVVNDYFSHALWQEEQAASLTEQSMFFVDMFRDEVPKNAMPCHALRPETLPLTEKEARCHLPLETVADLQKQARELGVTVYVLIMAAAALTTSRYCNSEDIVLGTGMHGRPEQAMSTIGMFSKELPVRTFPQAQKLFTDFIAELGASIAEVRAHQTCSMSAALAKLELTRDPSRKLFFDVSVNYLHAFPSVTMDDGVHMHLETFIGQALSVDWAFEVARQKDGIELSLQYSPLLYEDGIAQRALEFFKAILERIAGGEKDTLLELARLPEAHEAELFQKFCGVHDDSFLTENVITLFKKTVSLHPESLAVVAGEERYTYAELDDISDRLASHLMGLGIQHGATVGILVGRNAFMLIGALGVLKAGAAYVPIDPAYPMARIEFMLSDTEAEYVIVDAHLEDLLVNYGGTLIPSACIATLPESKTQLPSLSADDVVVLLFTSGTTGVPKGVLWSHDGLANMCAWYCNYSGMSNEDNLTGYAGFSFDAHLLEFFPALVAGASIHIITEDMRLNFPALRDYYNTHAITISFMTTQAGRQFATFPGLTTLTKLGMGGEALVPFEPRAGLNVYNLYGPTECTCAISAFHYDRYYDRPAVGKPAYNTDFYVLDGYGRLQPVGAEGELFVAGRQVTLGYKNRPEETAKAFLANPFVERTGHKTMYKTGDAVRFRADGNLEILGRRDSQVKIRGFRVELGEIENRIRDFDGIENAVVLPADAPGGGKCAVAYVIATEVISIDKLNSFIVAKLPEYMVPAVIMQVDHIPLTPNGKVDTRKLPAPIFSETTNNTEETATTPNSRLQTELSDIVAQVLGHSDFSVSTNLLRAGLASLNAIMVMAKVSEKYALDISVNAFLALPTILELENLLVDALLSRPATAQQTNAPHTPQTLFPLSANQMGVYYACVKQPDSILYNIPFRLDLAPNIHDAKRLQEAMLQVIDAHPVLTTQFTQQDGKLWQGQGNAPLAVEILQCAYQDLEKISQDFVRPFVLLDAPLCRFAVVHTEQSLHVLFDAHHCIFDGISVDVFLQTLNLAFMGETLQKVHGEPSLYALAQKESLALENSSLESSYVYIKDLLQEYGGVCELAPDLAHNNSIGTLAEYVQAVDKTAVQVFCKEYGITTASLFLAASSYALHRFLALNEGDSLYLATISNGRATANLSQSIGMFVRTLPLAIALPEQAQNIEFIEYTQNALRTAISHEEYPFTRIADDYGFEPSIMYACELGVVQSPTLAGQELSLVSLVPPKPKFPLSIHVEERDGAYVFALQYDEARYSPELMANLAQCMVTALSGMLSEPTAQLTQLSLINAEQTAFLQAIGEKSLQGEMTTLMAIFEQTVLQHADKIALKACDQDLTYAELNAQANRLAHALLKLGVQVEDRVAFMLERTSLVPIAMLGIMKAGCAFIPVDPTYPQERIEHVLQDSAAAFLLVDALDTESPWNNALELRDLLNQETTSTNPKLALSPENLAYLIYTSGSTGKPKGVMLTHAGIANYVLPQPQNIQMYALSNYATGMLSITTVAFDMFLKEAFGALMNGITLVFAHEEATRNPLQLAELFATGQADAFSATPSRMLDFMEVDILRAAILDCKVIMCGGEKYSPQLLEYLKESKARLYNSYGPTEITVSCNAKEIVGTKITVGAPLYNVREYVVDRHGNNLPVGVMGELLVGGRGVAKGYLNLPEETAARFVMHNNERVYRTGDLAAWTHTGEIIILGRNDGQIKLRGLRIELGEIEKALNALPQIKNAVVIVRHMGQEEHLCAYCIADAPLDFVQIREQLSKTLTHYMVPTGYMQLDSMPRTPNGKLDAKALPAPTLERTSSVATAYDEPVGELETALCAIFCEALNVEKIGATDNFFAHGGTSLGVTRLLGLAHKHNIHANKENNGQELSYTNIFASPTPRQLAKILQGEKLVQLADKEPVSAALFSDYAYEGIDALLEQNTINALQSEEPRPLGNALFTGATGFLGITLLYQFLKNEHGKAYCLLRKGRFSSVEKRLSGLLYFYFAERFDELIGERIIPIEGDVTDTTWVRLAQKESIHTVFNCAADVRHFAHDDSIERVNVGGAQRCIEFCQKSGARLIHVSTVSVAGFAINGYPEGQTLTEHKLYFGQHLENQYIRSKFMAERAILETMLHADAALDAKIMRVGNLTGRVSDGEFQINARSNSFAGRLRALSLLEAAPYAMADQPIDLSPVDSVADAIILLSRTPRACCLFHPVNNHAFFLGDLIDNMIAMDIPVKWCEMEVFNTAFEQAREEMAHMEDMVSLVAYQNMSQGKSVSGILTARRHTVQVLKRLGWQWPLLGAEYQIKFLDALKGLGYFDKN